MPSRTGDETGLRRAVGALLPAFEIGTLRAWGRGHIHATYLVEGRAGDATSRRYLVQRVNTAVFREPERLARNLERVTRHLAGVAGCGRPALELVRGPDGRGAHRDDAGRWWRAFPFVEGSRSAERAASPEQAERWAAAFGAFLADLADLDPGGLEEVLPGFHDLDARLGALTEAERRDPEGRGALGDEPARARRLAERLAESDDGAPLPRRVVHNDCKLNNLLVDTRTDVPLCVVDLDTVMPGHALFDFGELARTAAATAAEDEPDPARVDADPALLAALARGFVAGTRGLLEPEEIASFARAGPRMALENAVRFLTDHLEGDRYFPAHRPGHNLDRARAQLRLAERMLDKETELRRALETLAR